MSTVAVSSDNGIEITARVEGSGPPVVLLHGFPDLSIGWRHQVQALVAAGCRTIVPDMRGYGASSRPVGIANYSLASITHDVVAVIEKLADGLAMLVGHDWGGVIAWYVAMQRPDLLKRLVILNAPHPAAYRREIGKFSSQILRSWYAMFFQLPRLPEMVLGARDMRLLNGVWRGGPARDRTTLAEYRAAFSEPGAIRAALNWYRAAPRHPKPRGKRITIPVTILWGDKDRYLRASLAENLDRWVADYETIHFPSAGHWLQHDESDAVNEILVRLAR